MKKSGLADSPLFLAPQNQNEDLTSPPDNSPTQKEQFKKAKKTKEPETEQSSNDDPMTPRSHDTAEPRVHGVVVESIQKAVKEFGKEAATHRFTQTEKKEIADLIYTYKNRDIKTSENEIARIAVNFIFEDFKVNGENSVLHKILEALKG